MPSPMSIAYYAFHPNELGSIIQWKISQKPIHKRDASKDSQSLKRCFYFLPRVGRSFAAVIVELHPELLVPVTLFYLILRGLDTIEDDMTIPLEKKEPLLRNFDKILEQDGWTFNDNSPDEPDRQLLVEFDAVIEEFRKIKPAYRNIIKDITKRMGDGMADYAIKADHNIHKVETFMDYELYCHYVAGLVGEGSTRLFVEAGLANPGLLEKPKLIESMGQFLQQVNIIRDVNDDLQQGRQFWPTEIWSKHITKFENLFEPENREKALNVSSEMILTALAHISNCLHYLEGISEQSLFNFCAIPQSMAIATLDACFQNYKIFEKKTVKITKGEACQLMMESSKSLPNVCEVFRRYARKIAERNNPRDPNYLEMSMTLAHIEESVDSILRSRNYPLDNKSTTGVKKPARKQNEIGFSIGATVALTIITIGLFTLCATWLAGARVDSAYVHFKE